MDRTRTDCLPDLSDRDLCQYWEAAWADASLGAAHDVRGWYHKLYADVFCGKRVLEIGSGMGIDGIHFIRKGATWHFADIVQTNLELIRRIVGALHLPCDGFSWIQDFSSLDAIEGGFDFIYCQGSLINVPFDFARAETLHIVTKLKPGGRWIELCYPKERWICEGSLPFSQWGEVTDGEGTPWMEWYDIERLRNRFSPIRLKPIIALNFHENDFNWFDFEIEVIPTPAAAQTLATAPPRRNEEVPLPLACVIAHNGVVPKFAARCGAIEADTGAAQWSFALQLPLADALHAFLAKTRDQVIKGETPAAMVDVGVARGSVGVGVLDEGLRNYVSTELKVGTGERRTLTLPLPIDAGPLHLMLRNIASGEVTARLRIEKVALRWIAPR